MICLEIFLQPHKNNLRLRCINFVYFGEVEVVCGSLHQSQIMTNYIVYDIIYNDRRKSYENYFMR